MKRKCILCEGSTDAILLQYYMRKVHDWEDSQNIGFRYKKEWTRTLKRNGDELTIASVGE